MKKSVIEWILIALILIAILALAFGFVKGGTLTLFFEVVLYGGYSLLLLNYLLRAKSVFYIVVLVMLMAGNIGLLLLTMKLDFGIRYLIMTGYLGALAFAALLIVTAFSGKNFGIYLAAIGILVAVTPLVYVLNLSIGLGGREVQLIYLVLLVLIGGVKIRQTRGRVVSPEAGHTLTYFLLVSFQMALALLLAWF